ncbi:MAG TPA: diacylglycerol kinase family protein [Gaiellaceae bacterium]|nr:diacylglycerol kinase family protein [Gaiellaceae bacterium]
MRGFLIVNPHSGEEAGLDELLSAARARGIEVHELAAGEDLEQIARDADADAIGMAGGDGSLACVADVCLERKLPFVCVPFGTRNHFARDLGLDRDDPVAALDAFVDRREQLVDIGRVNGRAFLNNVSLGAYAGLVHRREEHRRRQAALARLRGLAGLFTHRRPLQIEIEGAPVEARIALVSNNAYDLEPATFGERAVLDAGRLHLYLTSAITRPEWRDQEAETFTIGASDPSLDAAIDGEPVTLDTPLEFEVEPRALRVLLPSGPDR